MVSAEMEDEEHWLRFLLRRRRAALRHARAPAAEGIIRELIGDAEKRLAFIEVRRRNTPG